MRFMVQVRATPETEAGVMPSKELVEAMGAFNEELVKAGIMLAGEGLQGSSKGARLSWSDGKLTVTDGPFAEAKELIAGYWLVEVKSKAEAIEWFSRCPPPAGGGEGVLDIRQVFETEDFPAEIMSAEEVARENRLRDQLANR
jgi:hypothetical protein